MTTPSHSPEIFTASIVVRGDFNPAIFTPDWLEKTQLIGPADAETARSKDGEPELVVCRQVSNFGAKWFSLQVLEGQFILSSKDAQLEAIKDLAAGIFQLLPHSPVRALGINFSGHYKMPSMGAYHQVGDSLAPKKLWNELFPGRLAGMNDLIVRIQRGERSGKVETSDEIRITVQASGKISPGIHISYNDHQDLTRAEHQDYSPGERVARAIDEHWHASWRDSLRVFDGILTGTRESQT